MRYEACRLLRITMRMLWIFFFFRFSDGFNKLLVCDGLDGNEVLDLIRAAIVT